MASFPFISNAWIECSLEFGEDLPPAGTFIWAKLPRLNDYPGSGTSPLTSSYTAPIPEFHKFHMALLYYIHAPQASVADGELSRIQQYAFTISQMSTTSSTNLAQGPTAGGSGNQGGPSGASGTSGKHGGSPETSGGNLGHGTFSNGHTGHTQHQHNHNSNHVGSSGENSIPMEMLPGGQALDTSSIAKSNIGDAGGNVSEPRVYSYDEFIELFGPTLSDDLELMDSLKQSEYNSHDSSDRNANAHDFSGVRAWLAEI
ncbi:hypothetical protein ABW20_dc0100366 [Dactylellina cionopaga]|nr:hypothetical protein ABW20_dc0100366 [Dactylellina cionopaga]